MSRYFLQLLLLAVFIIPATNLSATHIVGGRIGYNCLGNDQYEIEVSIYRDCFNGDQQAPFDDPAYIGIYNQFNVLVQSIPIALMDDDTLTTIITDPCLVIESEVCVHTTTYRKVVTLPFLPGGYTMSYQRCCRNITLENIINPVETGATFDIELTESAMLKCNSSPTFINYPAIYICADRELEFDHSAIDADGDSLVYRLCTPKAGGTLSDPQPIPPETPPPYDTVVWAPGFSVDNMLGLGEPLAIDPQTGLLTATPGITGQFVVGVCVEEYDSVTGELLSVTRRDFQYNVVICGEKAAALAAAEAQCDDLTLCIENQSTFSTAYEWCFDWPQCDSTSTTDELNFCYTYPDTGTWTIQLIAEPNSICADTFYHEVFLQLNSLEASYNVDVFECDNVASLELFDESVDTVSPTVAWFWEVIYGNPADTVTSTEQNPMFLVPLGIDDGIINFTVTSQNGCVQSLTQNFVTGTTNPGDAILPDIEACIGDSPSLNPNSPSYLGYEYVWAPAGLLSNANDPNPTVLNVTGDQLFSVTITPGSGACEIIREVQLTAVDLPVLDFSTFLECDGRTITFTNLSTNANAFFWDFGDPGSGADNNSTAISPSHTFPDVGTYTVTLSIPDTELCTDMITMEITIPETELTADFGIKYLSATCSEDSVVVAFEDLSTNTTLSPIDTWEWEIDPPGGVVMTGSNPTYTFFGSQTVDVTLTVTTADGCVSSSTQQNVEITIVENEDQFQDTLIICNGGSAQILPGGNPDYLYEWLPEDGIDDPTSPSPTFSPDVTTTYTVLVSHIGVDTCEFVEEVVAFVTPALNLEVNGDGVLCTDQAMLTATTDAPADITWLDDMGNTLATGNSYDFTITTTHNITVRAEDQYGCTEEEDIIVRFDPVDVIVPDTVAVCLGDELDVGITNLDGGNILTYTWTPVDAFVPGTANDASPDVIETIGQQTLYVTVENQFGCTYQDSVITAVYDDNINLSFTYEVQCDGSTVEFTNTSTDAYNYVWNFGDGSPLNYEESPTYNYGIAGEFVVTLSVEPFPDCVVPYVDTIMTINPTVTAAFDYDIVECSPDSAVVAFFDLSFSDFEIENWQWEPFGSIDQNPVIVFYNNEEVDVTLTITTSNGCMSSITEAIDIQLVELALADTIVMCKGDTTELNPGGATDQVYSWTPTGTLDDPTSANPNAFPTETTVYTVEVYKEGSDTCFYTDQVTVFVPADINLDLGDDIITCGENVTLTAMTDVDVDVEWFSVIDGPISEQQSVTVNPFGTDTIIATVTDQYGCVDSDTIVITDNGVDVADIPSEITACSGVDTTITITNIDPNDVLTYQWTPLENIVGPADQATVTINVPEGCVIFTCVITNQNDCEETVMTEVCVVPFDYEIPDTVYVCPNTPTGLNPDGVTSYDYMWTPSDNLSATDVPNPIFTSNVPGTYNYTATIFDDSQVINCETTEDVTVIIYPLLELATDGDTTMCEISTIPITATTAITADIAWFDDGGDNIGAGSPIDVTPVEGTNTYTAIATDPVTGCTDTSQVVVQVNILEIGIPDSIVYVCIDVPTEINPDGDSNLTYEWVPDTGLDLTNPWNPVATTSDTLFIEVTITDPVGGCFLIRNVTVIPYPAIIPVAQPDTAFICELASATLTVTSTVPAEYTWFSDAEMNDVVGTGASVVVNPANPQFYYVMAMDEFGCTEKDSAFVTRYPSLNLEAFGDTTLCEISTVPLWATSDVGVTFDWYEEGTDSPFAFGDTINVTPVEGTNNYIVIAEDTITGCLDTTMATVQVNVLEEGIPDSIVYVCSGVPTHINPAGYEGVIYDWIPDANISFDPPWDPIVTTTDTITYFVTIEDPVGMCYLETTVTVIPYPLILPVASPDTAFVCELDEAELSVTTESGIDAEYAWYSDSDLTDSIGMGATIIVDPDTSQHFWVTATDEFGCVEEDSVYVLRYPALNMQGFGDTTLCIVSTVPVWATTTEMADIEWFIDLTEDPIHIGDTALVTPVEGTNIYTAIATDKFTGCMDTAYVTVQVNPIEIGVPDPVIYVCPNVDVNFFSGNPDLIYTWDCDEEIDDFDPYNPVVNTNDTITCIVTVEDPAGLCYLEAPVMIIAYDEINPAITPPEVALCEFENVELMGSADVSPANFVWFSDSQMTDIISMDPNVVVSPDSTQYYYLMVTDEFGCSEKDSVLVIRNPSLNLVTDGDTTLCEIVPVTLTAETDLESTVINWYEGVPLPDDPFDSGSPIVVTPNEGTNTYTAIALDTITGCLDTSVVIVQVNPIIIDDIPPSEIFVCPNVDVNFFTGNPDLIYTWDCDEEIFGEPWNPVVNTNDTINCIVTIEDPAGMCYLDVPVTIIPYPEINPLILQDTTVCAFDPLALFVTSDLGDEVTYVWYDIDNNEIGTGESVIVTPVATEIYYVIATDEFGCSEVDSVQVDAYPIQAELLPQELIICETVDTEILTAVNNGPEDIVSYNWSPSGLVEVTQVDSVAIGTLTGTLNQFCVELTNEYGCVETECTTITMISLIDSLSITAVPDTILLDDSSVITVDGCLLCDFEWEWDSGDIDPLTGPVITATPDEPGDNLYTAYASLLGCEESISTSVYVIDKICDESFVFLPTAFTPNNDGVNDVLELRCFFKDEIEIEIMIYNRWGEEIIRSQDPYFVWDGTWDGEELPPDVYGFYLKVNCPGGEELIQKGSITLLK